MKYIFKVFSSCTPIFLRHFKEGSVAQNSSVIDDDVNSSKGVDCSFNDLVPIEYGVVISNGFASFNLQC